MNRLRRVHVALAAAALKLHETDEDYEDGPRHARKIRGEYAEVLKKEYQAEQDNEYWRYLVVRAITGWGSIKVVHGEELLLMNLLP